MYYVYILKSSLNQRYYVGHTDNLEKRLKQHNAGRTPSTKPYRPRSAEVLPLSNYAG